MSRDLNDRLVLLTGASAGIGAAAARIFLGAGARLVGVARDAGRLDALAESLGGGDRVTVIPADVADPVSMEAMTQAVLRDVGVPDVVVANAGIGLDALFLETGDDLWHRVLEVNVLGVVRTIRPFLPAMVERGSGRVLIVSSIVGKRGVPHYSAYSASKFALHGMADAMRSELSRTGVSVGVVCPASTTTEFQDHALRKGPRQRRVRPRRHPPESVARAIVRMATSRRGELVLTAEGKLLALANALVPGLVDRILTRALTE